VRQGCRKGKNSQDRQMTKEEALGRSSVVCPLSSVAASGAVLIWNREQKSGIRLRLFAMLGTLPSQ
jgi:hypothetical protein